mmetsp:Transcript_26738/g.89510  ORF Transcript_26738/g.89510 Transcript_26738/m.89510 type:complete len:326 (+) Transcript_26738:1492-2469(+)
MHDAGARLRARQGREDPRGERVAHTAGHDDWENKGRGGEERGEAVHEGAVGEAEGAEPALRAVHPAPGLGPREVELALHEHAVLLAKREQRRVEARDEHNGEGHEGRDERAGHGAARGLWGGHLPQELRLRQDRRAVSAPHGGEGLRRKAPRAPAGSRTIGPFITPSGLLPQARTGTRTCARCAHPAGLDARLAADEHPGALPPRAGREVGRRAAAHAPPGPLELLLRSERRRAPPIPEAVLHGPAETSHLAGGHAKGEGGLRSAWATAATVAARSMARGSYAHARPRSARRLSTRWRSSSYLANYSLSPIDRREINSPQTPPGG